MKKQAENVHQKLVPYSFIVLVNSSKFSVLIIPVSFHPWIWKLLKGREKTEYLENEKGILDEIKSIFHDFWSALFLVRYKKIENINFKDVQGLIQKEKVDIDWAKGAQIRMLANKIATQWCANIIIKESKKTVHYICFLFSHHYVHIMLLIWLKNLNCI